MDNQQATPDQLEAFFAELRNAAPVSQQLATVASQHSIRQVLLAIGLMIGSQSKDLAELQQFLAVVNSVALSHRQAMDTMINEVNPQGHA